VRFQIEAVLPNVAHGSVVGRKLDDGDFVLGSDSYLGGVAIQPRTEVARALNESGEQRSDLFVFWLSSSTDISSFSVGQVATLEPHPNA
jgi:hypothetical protein